MFLKPDRPVMLATYVLVSAVVCATTVVGGQGTGQNREREAPLGKRQAAGVRRSRRTLSASASRLGL